MNALLDAFKPYRWVFLSGMAGIFLGYHTWAVRSAETAAYDRGDAAGAARVQAQFDAFKGEAIAQSAQLIGAARAERDAMKTRFAQREKEFEREKNRIASERDALLDRLRDRAQRPAGGAGGASAVPGNTGVDASAQRCTGAGLYREDAAFLVGEAARADLIRAALAACYADMDAARAAIERFTERFTAEPRPAGP
jgi:hypothetical protein